MIRKMKVSKPSRGEQRIIDFLVSNCVDFKREYFFADCYYKNSNTLIYFDFYLVEYNLCIEFDGAQHYASNKPEKAKIYDFVKTAYCHKNNIHLLRIKYDQYENIENIICAKIDSL